MTGYALGVDLGTTYTAAATAAPGAVASEVLPLGNRAAATPSVVRIGPSVEVLVGEAALRRLVDQPELVAREFKRRFGDPVPLVIGGAPYSPEQLMAELLRHVVDVAAERQGAAPARVALTHPAGWGPYKLDLLLQAARMADLDQPLTLSEPEAAATYYCAQERLPVGSLLAVYDLGGGTFDAVVLRRTAEGFDLLGRPEGVERLGGIDLDEAVLRAVLGHAAEPLDAVDLTDPTVTGDLERLRRACAEAKEALSFDTDAAVEVAVGPVRTAVRLSRGELESLARPLLDQTVAALGRALRGAGVTADELDRVLLVGGASRMPLVAEVVGDALGRPVAVDADPKHVVARGAAMAAATDLTGRAGSTAGLGAAALASADQAPVIPPPASPATAVASAPEPPAAPASPRQGQPGAVPPAAAVGVGPPPGAAPRRRTPLLLGLAAGALVLVGGAGAVLLTGAGDDGEGAAQAGDVLVAEAAGDACPAAPSICLISARAVDDDLLVDFTTDGVQLRAGAEPHARFFLSDAPGSAVRWESQDPFGTGGRGFTRQEAAARQICAVLAQGDQLVEGSGSCIEIP